MAPLTDFLRLYISTYLENIQEHHENLIPLPQPSVPVRSHLGAFGAPPEGASITEGFYINTTLLEKGLLVAHQFCLLMAHYWCATSITPLVIFTNGAPLVRH